MDRQVTASPLEIVVPFREKLSVGEDRDNELQATTLDKVALEFVAVCVSDVNSWHEHGMNNLE